MEDQSNSEKQAMNEPEFMRYATKRLAIGVVITLVILWLFVTVLGFFDKPETEKTAHTTSPATPVAHVAAPLPSAEHHPAAATPADDGHGSPADQQKHAVAQKSLAKLEHGAAAPSAGQHDRHAAASPKPADQHAPQYSTYKTQLGTGHTPPPPVQLPKGVAFIDAAIQPMDYELNERFWGWRPNDILNFTDNYNNFQLGVLEVTRRTAVILAERISRTGSTASFDRNLQSAMNWFMIQADRYWFPSPESKYQAGLDEFQEYRERLLKGKASFHTRADNLIPLLLAYEDLLGSCDENLVRTTEKDGSPVSHFQADDYFFYARGVASAMYTILEAIQTDFQNTLEARRGMEVLHHAIESCHHAMEIDPVLITNSHLSGMLANHRANMAAPISHARFYLGVLITALST
ncbi:MAG: DUF2333 family protein [Desulfobacterales bacterium]|nr:DUF2333 family protein [Desulfobacterales bacterium]